HQGYCFGETPFKSADGFAISTVASEVFSGSDAIVAVTVTNGGSGTVSGAVYSPVAEIVPQSFPGQPFPLTLQSTVLSALWVIGVENCCDAPAATFTRAGAMK